MKKKLKKPRGVYTRTRKSNLQNQLATDAPVKYVVQTERAPTPPAANDESEEAKAERAKEEALDSAEAKAEYERDAADKKAVRAACAKLSAGEPKAIRKAVRILDQDKTEINATAEAVVKEMKSLHPDRLTNDDGSEIPFPAVPAGDHTCQDVQPSALITCVATLINLVAPGESRLTEELLYAALQLPAVAEIMSAFVTDIRNARVHKAAARALRRCRAVAAGKPGTGLRIRPIAIGEVLVKVAATLEDYAPPCREV